jgi:hypothetical protein
MAGDGSEPFPGDVADMIEEIEATGEYTVVRRRKSPDERVVEEVNCILFALQRLEAAVDLGGSFHPVKGPRCVDNITRRLTAAVKHVAPELEAAE